MAFCIDQFILLYRREALEIMLLTELENIQVEAILI